MILVLEILKKVILRVSTLLNDTKVHLASALDRGRGRTVKFSVCTKNIQRCHRARIGE